jgi:hypothetical protein
MAEARRSDKELKKDQSAAREIRREISEEIRSSGTKPQQKQPNRDRARGDWDRSGVHHDPTSSRGDEESFDERS